MKKKIFISMLILLLISISAVSASDDLNQNITQTNDIDNDIKINDDVLSASSTRTFMDLQDQIAKTSPGSTLTLYDDYAYTEGTDRTIGIAIYPTTKDITIDGNGHTLDGKRVARILYVNAGATNIVVKNLNFVNGYQQAGAGAIYWGGESGTVTDCNFTSNIADKSGGAILWSAAKGTITNNRFEKCVSNTQSGGAIYCNEETQQTTISNNVFTDNSVKTCGAGIGSAGPNSIISNNKFMSNWADESGAALYTSGANSKIINNEFIGNKVKGSGGAIYIETNGIIMDGCYFKDNFASEEAGGSMRWKGNSGTMTNTVFDNNVATVRGGAIFWNGDNARIENNNFTNNVANTASGGALIYQGQNAQISSNNFEKNSAPQGYGGAVYIEGNSNKLSNNRFNKNTAGKGGGAIYYEGTSGSVTSNTITQNNAENACGIRWVGDSATITGNTFKGNKNTNGLNIIYGDGAKAKVTQNTFLNNKESDECIRWNSADAVITPNTYKEDTVTTLTGSDVTSYYGDSAYLIFTLSTSTQPLSNKKVTVSLNGKNTDLVTNANGQVSIDVKDLNVATYVATAQFGGDSDYDASSGLATVNINRAPTKLVLKDIKDIIIGQELAMTAEVNATGGTVTFDVDGTKTTLPLPSTGKAVYLFKPALGDHTYNVVATYNPSNNYLSSSASATFNVTRKPTSMTGANVTIYTGGKGKLIFTLMDNTDSITLPLTEVNIDFNGQSYTEKTDLKGQISIDLENLGVGTYDASVSYDGDALFAPSDATATAFVKATIESEDLVANYGDATYIAKFVDSTGKALPEGTYVSFTIGNEAYREAVDSKGTAKLNIDRTPGKYIITNINTVTGEETKNNITINKMPTETTISGVKDINVGENLTATIKVNASNGILTIKLNDESHLVNYTGGDYNIHLDELPDGDYTLTATFKPENQYYAGSSAKATFSVTKKANAITVETKNIEEGEDAVFYVTTTVESGEVALKINSKSYTENLTNGKATFTVSNLTADTYEYTVSTPGDKYYESNSTTGTINVKSTKMTINAPDVTKYFSGSERLTVKVTDKNGAPLKGILLFITINKVEYNRTTGDAGTTSIGLNLPSGNYTADIVFKGNEDYSAVNTTSNVVIKTTVFGSDVEKIEKSPEQYVATFLDSTGKYLPAGEHMTFNINGVFYDRVIRENGQARLNLNLEANTYIITATNTKTGEQSSNNITIKPRIVNNSDVTKYFKNDTQYYVTLLDDNGNPVKAGETVTFNVNGVFYERKTNENGIAKLNINLEPKDYIITAEYKNCRVSNNIKVLPILSAKDMSMRYRDGSKFEATLVDGQGKPYAGQNITFNINGVFYTRATDANGIARLNINLMAGKYIITSSYNGSNIANTITINS